MHAPVKSKEFWYPTAFCGWGDEEHAAIERVTASGKFTMGEEVRAFEDELAAYHGREHAVMVNSGSSANLLMVATLMETGRIHRGNTVQVPALAWATTYAPLIQHGLKLNLVDCDQTWNAAWPCDNNGSASLQVLCSILGNSCERFVGTADFLVIEDNCESIGAICADGRKTGTLGLMSSLSFFYSHQLSAIEGGAVLTDDDECAEMLRILRSHGWTKDVWPSKSFEEEYEFLRFGYNVRPLEMHAAIAREQLKKLDTGNVARRRNWDLFFNLTQDWPIDHVSIQTNSAPAPFGLAFTVKNRETRLKLVHALRAADIDCRLPTGGSFRLHKYGEPWRDQQTPNADHIHNMGLFLGNAPYLIDDKIERVVQVMRKVLLL
jgi:CDP-6-deoxy-D-xylo-4-hexulose-3-dehydrase